MSFTIHCEASLLKSLNNGGKNKFCVTLLRERALILNAVQTVMSLFYAVLAVLHESGKSSVSSSSSEFRFIAGTTQPYCKAPLLAAQVPMSSCCSSQAMQRGSCYCIT